MKRLLAVLTLICMLVTPALAVGGNATELSEFMYGDLSQTASYIGGMTWEGDWEYANDIEVAYVRDDMILAGNTDNEIKLISLSEPNGYCLFGLQVGMAESVLQPFMNMYDYHTYEDGEKNYYFTLSEEYDGYAETLWVVAEDGRLTYVIYEVGYGHD